MVEAVKRNFPQREIADAAFELQQQIDAGERMVVGVNSHVLEDESQCPILRIDQALERKQLDRLQAARATREGAQVERTLAALRERGGAARSQLDGAAAGLRSRLRLGGRDRGVAAAGVRRLHRDAGVLAPQRAQQLARATAQAAELLAHPGDPGA